MRHLMIGPLLLALAAPLAYGASPSPAAGANAASAAGMPAAQAMPGHPALDPALRNRPKVPDRQVDINSAGRKELMTLPGIGAAEADKIIANRPYLTKTELVTKGVLPTGPFVSLRHQVVAMQKIPPEKKKAAKPAAPKAAATPASAAKAP